MSKQEVAVQKSRARDAAVGVRRSVAGGLDTRDVANIIANRFFDSIPLEPSDIISAFWPMRSEIDAREILKRAGAAGHTLALPVVERKAQPLIFRTWAPGQALVNGSFGEQIPDAAAPETTPSVLVVPLLAFDRRGFRLGYGGGYYDRTLEALRRHGRAVAVGIAYAAQELPAVPIEPTDQRLDWVLTETETIRIAL